MKTTCYNGKDIGKGHIVPCGTCIACRKMKGRKWTTRLLMEHGTATKHRPGSQNWFVTFTYKNENLPLSEENHPTLAKRSFLKWINNAQTRYRKFRYFAVGEYGDNFLRPHYHAALFDFFPEEIQSLLARWDKGFTHTGLLQGNRAAYLCGYTTKKLTSGTDPRLPPGVEPEFRASSRVPPIGYAGICVEVERYRNPRYRKLLRERGDCHRSFRLNGNIYPLDEYCLRIMRQKLGIPITHEGRIRANENYLDYHNLKDAEQCLTTYENQETHYANKAKWKRGARASI